MDYWPFLRVHYYDNFAEFIKTANPTQLFLATTKAARRYTDAVYGQNAFIIFGKESAGLPAEIREQYPDTCIRVPMLDEMRSLNLSNAVAIVLYEALRQNNFYELK